MSTSPNRRILLIDDTPAIHENFRKILTAASTVAAFELESASHGEAGLAKVVRSRAAGRHYAMAFVGMGMRSGWDGVTTIERLWQVDPLLQIVAYNADADYVWGDLLVRLDFDDRLLILKSPFAGIEVRHLANALIAKRQMSQQAALKMASLEAAVAVRTRDLCQVNRALSTEIAERGRLESQQVQSAKLAAIGQLAAGVAHQINNPLGFALSNLGTLRGYVDALLSMLAAHEVAASQFGSSEEVGKLRRLWLLLEIDHLKADLPVLLDETREGLARVRWIVDDLRNFARIDSASDWQWFNLHQGIDAALNLAGGEVKDKTEVIKEYGALPEIECLPSQLNQVIMNLLVNAAQAIGDQRGRIVIRTGRAADHVWLEVEDSGSGIAAENLPRIFEPFFTTKAIGKGSGLGLSMSYGIIQSHHGRIEVRSEIGKGSTFRVELPVRQPARGGVCGGLATCSMNREVRCVDRNGLCPGRADS
ncbi:MAG: hybrid sensor histidine kinase/response regulator [Dechloromonas sp.]|nr:hybrid sensor histidine kinase/response regulator [Dechloromonas sp.]